MPRCQQEEARQPRQRPWLLGLLQGRVHGRRGHRGGGASGESTERIRANGRRQGRALDLARIGGGSAASWTRGQGDLVRERNRGEGETGDRKFWFLRDIWTDEEVWVVEVGYGEVCCFFLEKQGGFLSAGGGGC